MSRKAKAPHKTIERYTHGEKRVNNPPAGLVNHHTDSGEDQAEYAAPPPGTHTTPHFVWAGKHDKISIDTVSLHIHERIDPATIIEKALRPGQHTQQNLLPYFDSPENKQPLRRAIEFYTHEHGWSNRLIAGDSLLVMNSLLKRESMAGKIQMIYVDPPYGIKYNSNFQPFVNKREARDGNAADLTREPETIKAFRDTWRYGIHSYLTYFRDRMILAKELLSESGSIFVQIGDENMHLVRAVLDETFGRENSFAAIIFKKKNFTQPGHAVNDYILHYAKDKSRAKTHPIYGTVPDPRQQPDDKTFNRIMTAYGTPVKPRDDQTRERLVDEGGKWFTTSDRVISQHPSETRSVPITIRGQTIHPGPNSQWGFDPITAIPRLEKAGRLYLPASGRLRAIVFWDDLPRGRITNLWTDTTGERNPTYVVQTSSKVVERCIVMTTDPGDLVLDLTCGSGTTAYAAERWGRRWITCDTSRIAVTLARQRLATALYPYFQLNGASIEGGFQLHTVPYVDLKSISENPDIDTIWDRHHPIITGARAALAKATGAKTMEEWDIPSEFPPDWPSRARAPWERFREARQIRQSEMDHSIREKAAREPLHDHPIEDPDKTRVSGPFTVEAVPAPSIKSLDDIFVGDPPRTHPDAEHHRQEEWRRELLKTGIRGRDGNRITFSVVEPHHSTKWIHARAETKEDTPKDIVVSFGPAYAPLGPAHVSRTLEEAHTLVPRPDAVLFAALQFDPEAEKDIGETKWPGVSMLKAHMNADILTKDLRKGDSGSDSFWLMGEPDILLKETTSGHVVEVRGFDYYDSSSDTVVSRDSSRIAMWMLDTDYDGRSIHARQVFFPGKDSWEKLAKTLDPQIDEEMMERYQSTISIPFRPGPHSRIAVKIIDDRGIELMRAMDINP